MKIGILGAGKIGTTIATLLESCEFCTSVTLGMNRIVAGAFLVRQLYVPLAVS